MRHCRFPNVLHWILQSETDVCETFLLIVSPVRPPRHGQNLRHSKWSLAYRVADRNDALIVSFVSFAVFDWSSYVFLSFPAPNRVQEFLLMN